MLIQTTKNFGSDRLKVLVFADSGVGKTTLARTMPDQTLVISLESGLLSISDKDIAVVDATTNDKREVIPREERINRLKDIYVYLQSEEAKKNYRHIFFDSLSECSDNLYEKHKKIYPAKKDSLNLWEDMKTEMRSLIRAFRDLPYYNCVFTALETRNQDENARFFHGPFVQPKSLAEELNKFFDYVWRLEIHDEETGEVRKLRTQPTETIRAKSRTTEALTLPDLVPADLKAIFNHIKGANHV